MTRSFTQCCGLVLAVLGSCSTDAVASIVVTLENSNSDTIYDGSANNADLANSGQPSLASVTSTRTPAFGWGNLNDGAAATTTTESTFYRNTELSTSVTFTLDTTVSPNGYDVSTIRSIAGWAGANVTQANQKWAVLYSKVGSSTFHLYGTIDHSPFSASSTAPSSTRVTLADTTGTIASNVDVLRFNLIYPGLDGNNSNPGTVYREIDIEGVASAAPPPPAPLNLIQNPSFESPSLSSGGFQLFSNSAPLDANWVINGEVELVRGTFGTIAADGQQWLSLESLPAYPNNVGSISQTFATIPGASYELSFDYNALGNSAVTTPWNLTYDLGGSPTVLQIPNPAQLTLGAWYHESQIFVATGPTTTLTFRGESKVSGFYGPAIDNVSVTFRVPEPSSWVLAALGLLGLALCGWRQKRKCA